ncbi:MAG: transcription antitermination factor NusB [Clostridia bacterium]|nr:transcription antitermination factor NusB [Clostridia bacterium]
MLTRKNARENLFILIFEKSFNNDTAEEILETAISVRDFEVDDYIKSAFLGIDNNLDEIDNIITENTKGWKKERISKVALALLRLAVYEIIFIPDIPASVSVNEAVVLCKKYATQEDASFINGILGAVVKKYNKGE